MSLARHPTWMWIKRQIEYPSWKVKVVHLLFCVSLTLAVHHFTRSLIWFYVTMAGSVVLPALIVGLLDIYFRIQFSLIALLISILTLQIPVAILVTAESGLATWIGTGLLLIWVLLVGAYVKIQLLIDDESSKGGRWKRIDPDEVSPKSEKSAD